MIVKIEYLLMFVAALLLFSALVMMPFDIISFYADKATYARVHHLDMNEANWEWKYLIGWFYIGSMTVAGLTLFSLRLLKKEQRVIKGLNRTFLILFFGAMFLGFYNWIESGFDH